jgi:glycosyltransferase involved in cell wall biosynthesis
MRELRPALEPVSKKTSPAPSRTSSRCDSADAEEPTATHPPTAAAVIPTLNEAETIAAVIGELPRDIICEVIVADSGSRDNTPTIAQSAGARIVSLTQSGYGRACAAGAAAAAPDSTILLFLDGDGADRADLAARLIAPIQAGTHDFVIASRVRGEREPGSMLWHQLLAGHLAGWIMSALYGVHYTDMCAFRAIRRDALNRLDMRETTYGWNIEMQMEAARAGLRILEVPMPYRCRAGGTSKVAGSFRVSLRAAWRIVLTILRVAARGR